MAEGSKVMPMLDRPLHRYEVTFKGIAGQKLVCETNASNYKQARMIATAELTRMKGKAPNKLGLRIVDTLLLGEAKEEGTKLL